jgi:branched-chain amino acid transport system substrate-binding protein
MSNGTAITRRALVGGAAGLALSRRPVFAQDRSTVRVGLLTDMSGPSSSITGVISEVAARLAIQDFQSENPEFSGKVEFVVGDFQSKPDIAVGLVRSWLDQQGIDVIMGLPLSAAALGTIPLLEKFDRVGLLTEAGSSDLTGKYCSSNHIQWTYDSYGISSPTVNALVQDGGDTWFFVTADFKLGHQLVEDTMGFVDKAGGKTLGKVAFPYDSMDFASFLLQAQASKAKVIGFATPGDAATNCIKQAAEFGIGKNQKIALLISLINNIHAVGLKAAQGLYIAETFYWDKDDGTRAFAKRVAAQANGTMPNMVQAGDYSALWHYLKVVAKMGVPNAKASGRAVIAAMKDMPTSDPLFGSGVIRRDGRKIHDVMLFRVKAPENSRYPWDYYELVKTIPGDKAFRPLSEGGCAI